ncbi:short chain dehydrogenase [Moesziomyces aphidis]|uniref:Short chain dehydrogenase n=1 Tax=Moesziomyces aphidis TaxID=84754 RepID=W3VTN8_MOEAP|nr:short chain dehydrogenase [Moesziomyces aphidis]
MSDTAKVVLISGGNTGIGAATAELLASQGWRVIISGRNADSAKRVTDSITAKGGQVRFLQADIGRENEVIRLHKDALDIWGRLDAAVNNAGISTDSAMFHELDTKHFRDMLEVNVLGLFWSMKEQLKHFSKSGKGHIVNLSSIAGMHGVPFTGSYSATKHAVSGMTRSAALDYAKTDIRINAVAPGAIQTDILSDALRRGVYTYESIADMFPTKKLGVALDIAQAISFLLNSNYATGSFVSVDGGYGI